MQRFDCLAIDSPLLGPHLIEASAGTGKTFSIEHIYVRLILESKDPPIGVEEILAVTFTRAATRELKERIRSNLEKALDRLQEGKGEGAPPYLQPFFGSEEAIRSLSDAISGFERSQIFTIHGFCYRMLQEFAFEAKIGLSLPDPDKERAVPEKLRRIVKDFLLAGLNEDLLCPEQCSDLLKEFSSVEKLMEQLLSSQKGGGAVSFLAQFEEYKNTLAKWVGHPIEERKLLEDFRSLEKGYKVGVKGDFEGQVRAFANSFREPSDPLSFRKLLKERGSLLEYLEPQNRKVRAASPPFLHYPGFFDWARAHLSSFFVKKRRSVFRVLESAWNPIAETVRREEERLNPDEILLQMKKAIEMESFAKKVRQKYAVAIIDEFQDTDALQWEIFRSLFLDSASLRALYLVGDPKQSIYRFRKADIYTYFKARDFLGEDRLYRLDTNFRSSKKLVMSLNALFDRDWIRLPKMNTILPYLPVESGSSLDSEWNDEKGAVHFFPKEEEFFYIAQEIEKLLPQVGRLGAFAILVKDRHQSEKALQFLKERGINAVARSRIPLGQTFAFQALRELFEAIASPRHAGLAKIVKAGPFGFSEEFPFFEYKRLLEEKGLVPFCRSLLDFQVDGRTVRERLVSFDLSFYRDTMQIFEWLFAREGGFSFVGLKRALSDLEHLSIEEGAARRMDTDPDAVQIMTIHLSKGLEFDIVFAIGLSSRTPAAEEEEEEFEAEKLRQLYVAMTRAKRRLYVPLVQSDSPAKEGTHSPLELFFQPEGDILQVLESLSKKVSLTYEHPGIKVSSGERSLQTRLKAPSIPDRSFPSVSFLPSYLSSFTSLAGRKEGEIKRQENSPLFNLHTMPRGSETGILIHSLFEKIFSSSYPIWRDVEGVKRWVDSYLKYSPLLPWNQAIQEMVVKTLVFPFQAEGEFFSLSELGPTDLQVEMEFLFSNPPDFVKGFIDLVFSYRDRIYFLDWKTNWLGETDGSYGPDFLKEAMREHDYELQAALYARALSLHLEGKTLGGAFYYFLRGNSCFYFQPDLQLIQDSYAKPSSS